MDQPATTTEPSGIMTFTTKHGVLLLCLCLGLIFGIITPLMVENTARTDTEFCQALPSRIPLDDPPLSPADAVTTLSALRTEYKLSNKAQLFTSFYMIFAVQNGQIELTYPKHARRYPENAQQTALADIYSHCGIDHEHTH